MQYSIEGMHCASCVVKIEKALRGVPGVTRADVNLATEIATVEGTVTLDALNTAVRKVGRYELLPTDET